MSTTTRFCSLESMMYKYKNKVESRVEQWPTGGPGTSGNSVPDSDYVKITITMIRGYKPNIRYHCTQLGIGFRPMFKAEATPEVNTRYPSNKVCLEVRCELEHALQVAEIEDAINP